MKAQFLVTIEGKWLENDKVATASMVKTRLNKGVKEAFEHLADSVAVISLTKALAGVAATSEVEGELPKLSISLYEKYPAMSAYAHEQAVKEYALAATRSAK